MCAFLYEFGEKNEETHALEELGMSVSSPYAVQLLEQFVASDSRLDLIRAPYVLHGVK